VSTLKVFRLRLGVNRPNDEEGEYMLSLRFLKMRKLLGVYVQNLV